MMTSPTMDDGFMSYYYRPVDLPKEVIYASDRLANYIEDPSYLTTHEGRLSVYVPCNITPKTLAKIEKVVVQHEPITPMSSDVEWEKLIDATNYLAIRILGNDNNPIYLTNTLMAQKVSSLSLPQAEEILQKNAPSFMTLAANIRCLIEYIQTDNHAAFYNLIDNNSDIDDELPLLFNLMGVVSDEITPKIIDMAYADGREDYITEIVNYAVSSNNEELASLLLTRFLGQLSTISNEAIESNFFEAHIVLAIRHSNLAISHRLLSEMTVLMESISQDVKSSCSLYVLILAAAVNDLKIVDDVIDSPQFLEESGYSLGCLLGSVAEMGNLAVIEALIASSKFDAIPIWLIEESLWIAMDMGYEDIVTCLQETEHYAKLLEVHRLVDLLLEAIDNCDVAVASAVVSLPEYYGIHPKYIEKILEQAIEVGNLEIIDLIMSSDRFNDDSEEGLYIGYIFDKAMEFHHLDIIAYLIRSPFGQDLSSFDVKRAHKAAIANNHAGIIEALVDADRWQDIFLQEDFSYGASSDISSIS